MCVNNLSKVVTQQFCNDQTLAKKLRKLCDPYLSASAVSSLLRGAIQMSVFFYSLPIHVIKLRTSTYNKRRW